MLEQLHDVCDMDDLKDHCPNRKVRSRVLCKMSRRKQVYVVQVQLPSFVGPPRKVYCRHKIYSPNHDNAVWKLIAALGRPESERERELEPVNGIRPDRVLLQPVRRYLELDAGTEHQEEIAGKAQAYAPQDKAVLWVCPTAARRKWLIEKTAPIHDKSFYAVYAEVIANPHGAVWMSAAGNMRALSFVANEVATNVGK